MNPASFETRTLPHIAGIIAGLMLVAALPLCRSAIAQAPATSEKAKKDLESRRIELENAQKRTTSLETDVSGLKAERERLNVRLVETAALIKTSEAKLTAMEDRLGELEEQEKLLRGSLNQRHGQIAKLLAALQRMGRNPPPVLITQREDALKMVRSAMMLAAAFPEMRGQALALAGRLTELVRVMTEIRDQSQRLKAEMTRLTGARTRLSGLLETKKVSLDERRSELKRMRLAAAEISDSVTDLNELIARLDEAVQTNTGLGAYDAETKRQAQAEAAMLGAGPTSAADSAKQDENKKIAALSPPSTSPNYVELAPGATLMPGSPGRI
ncbi:MAG: peptidase M23, partial [Hyphomicrobium sp.]